MGIQRAKRVRVAVFRCETAERKQIKDSAIFTHAPPPFGLFLLSTLSLFLSLSLSLFLCNPGEQSAAEAKTAELSSTLIRDRSALTALTTPFDPFEPPRRVGPR